THAAILPMQADLKLPALTGRQSWTFHLKKVRDPVCGMEVDASTATDRSQYAGQTVYFCSATCHARFNARPDSYMQGQPAAPADAKAAATGRVRFAGTNFTCPMHPEIERDQPGACPICGMTLELAAASPNTPEDNSELTGMTYRFW